MSKSIFYKLQFFDSARFMASSLSSIVDNPAKGIPKTKCKYGHDDKKCKTSDVESKKRLQLLFLNTQTF